MYGDGPFRTDVVDHDRFRSLPAEATFLTFLVDASRAVKRISTLRKFIMKLGDWRTDSSCLNLSPFVSRVFELWYLKPGMYRSPPADLLTSISTIRMSLEMMPTSIDQGFTGVQVANGFGRGSRLNGRPSLGWEQKWCSWMRIDGSRTAGITKCH